MMIAIFNKFRIGLSSIYILLAILTASVTLVSCSKDDELEIQNEELRRAQSDRVISNRDEALAFARSVLATLEPQDG